MGESELLPCPFCSSGDVESRLDVDSDWWWIACNNCNASGPVMTVSTDDQCDWNTRAGEGGEAERLREALTPSAETKTAYMGEFAIPVPMLDDDGGEVIATFNVPWVTIKQIMAAIRARAALRSSREG